MRISNWKLQPKLGGLYNTITPNKFMVVGSEHMLKLSTYSSCDVGKKEENFRRQFD